MPQKRKRTPSPPESAESTIFRSDPIEDRTSTFIGYYSPSLAPKELQHHADFASASHKILGWRRTSNQQSISSAAPKLYVSGSDDDGEKYGGKKVEKVLEGMNVTGTCVVARWYGGVMLGPVRFAHMEECAKGAVKAWQGAVAEEKSKKVRLEMEETERVKLVKVLEERDQSIVVLRQLAAEKEAQLKAEMLKLNDVSAETILKEAAQPSAVSIESPAEPVSSPTAQATVPDSVPKPQAPHYAAIPLDRLRALERARDATLSFLLKRIDKAEEEQKARQSTEQPP